MHCVSKELTRRYKKCKQQTHRKRHNFDHLEASVDWMTKEDPRNFEELSAERITGIFPDLIWNDQAWLKPECISQFSEQCNGHRMYVHQT